MRHSRAQALFSAALDGELDGRRQRRFEEHLSGCADCRRAWELFRLSHRLVGQDPGAVMSADFTESLIGRLREERLQGAPRPVGRRHVGLAVAAAALLLLFLWGDRLHVLPKLRGTERAEEVIAW